MSTMDHERNTPAPTPIGQATPGPWRTDKEFGHEVVLGKDGAMVADCAILHKKRLGNTNKNNARLMAAAPELLEALKMARKCIAYCRRAHKDAQSGEGVPVEIFLDAAIAKAEGRS